MANAPLSFRVAGTRTQLGDVEVMLDGKPVRAALPHLVLDLVSIDGEHRFPWVMQAVAADEFEAQRETFAVGAEVKLTLEASRAAPVVAAPLPQVDEHDGSILA